MDVYRNVYYNSIENTRAPSPVAEITRPVCYPFPSFRWSLSKRELKGHGIDIRDHSFSLIPDVGVVVVVVVVTFQSLAKVVESVRFIEHDGQMDTKARRVENGRAE